MLGLCLLYTYFLTTKIKAELLTYGAPSFEVREDAVYTVTLTQSFPFAGSSYSTVYVSYLHSHDNIIISVCWMKLFHGLCKLSTYSRIDTIISVRWIKLFHRLCKLPTQSHWHNHFRSLDQAIPPSMQVADIVTLTQSYSFVGSS